MAYQKDVRAQSLDCALSAWVRVWTWKYVLAYMALFPIVFSPIQMNR